MATRIQERVRWENKFWSMMNRIYNIYVQVRECDMKYNPIENEFGE